MPTTQLEYPILQSFFCVVEGTTGMPPQPLDASPEQLRQAQQRENDDHTPKQLPKGVVLGPDGKPCRSCTSFASWAAMTKQQQSPFSPTTSTSRQPTTTTITPAASLDSGLPPDCPPDVDRLGNHTWTFLHTLSANYPANPTPSQQSDTKSFISLFSRMYPCWSCAADFRDWMQEPGNEIRVSSRSEFGKWMCEAHNAVNVKLGKEEFDCGRWEERWRTGWKDGRCDP